MKLSISLFSILFFQSCISFFLDALSPEKSKYSFGFMDRTGKVLILQEYEGADRFSHGLAPVKKNGLWGYIDTKGIVVIPFQFQSAKPFSDNLELAPVEKFDAGEKAWGYIDLKGNWIIPPSYYNATPFYDGVAEVATEKFKYKSVSKRYDKYFLTKDKKYIYHNGLYSYGSGPGRFSEGLMPSCKDGKWGFKDSSNKWIIEPKYTIVGNFENGLARVQLTKPNPYNDCEWISEEEPSGLWGYIDKSGKEVIPLKFKAASNFSKEGLALVDDMFAARTFQRGTVFSRYFINRDGNKAFDLSFQKAEPFSDFGYTIVGQDEKNTLNIEPNKTAFIDKSGKKKEFILGSGEEIFNLRMGTNEMFRVTIQIKPDPNKYEHKYVSRYYSSKDLTQSISQDFPPCFGSFASPPNCMSDNFYEGLAWIAKEAPDSNK
ncbi:MAG: WG repeat-containing protein [Leptospiraceae bacterium]|nr:WG repeat-containing protein [Leptospiraceae bacterium]